MRYLPLSDVERLKMLRDIGTNSVRSLFAEVAALGKEPEEILSLDNIALEKELSAIADKNVAASSVPCFLGAGIYHHYVPPVIDYMVQRGEFLTSYTPYQPEVSQGTLQALFEYQTQVARLFGLEVANASLYDGATAVFEAVSLALRHTKRNKVLVSGGVSPDTVRVLKTYLQFAKVDLQIHSPAIAKEEKFVLTEDVACIVLQVPSFFGEVNDYTELALECHKKGILVIFSTFEPLVFGVIKSAGEMGADIAVGEGMSLAGHLNFGGPSLGLFATKKELMRAMAGRIVGETVDENGKRGFVLTMATREQHIRREKATSNICTNAGIMALAFSMHMTMLGEIGFKKLAKLNHTKTVKLAAKLEKIEGVKILNRTFFNEFTLKLDGQSAKAVSLAMANNAVLGGVPVSHFYKDVDKTDWLLVAVTEMVSDEDMYALTQELSL